MARPFTSEPMTIAADFIKELEGCIREFSLNFKGIVVV
ncbi:hypothetical protein RTCIAT899_PB01250 (plasmid) [Rhizobium tropici CIAT 899]|nr:hypothetical protein RTCIAT899_PB01250 [Rhizobium tropici CIAT 899]